MGQGQSINPEEFQEDYYMFFDKNRWEPEVEKNTYTRLVNYRRAFGTKYIRRYNEVDIANLSTDFSVNGSGSYKPSIDSDTYYQKPSIDDHPYKLSIDGNSHKQSIDSEYSLVDGTRTPSYIGNVQVNAQSPKISLDDLEIAGNILDNGKAYTLDEYGSPLNKHLWQKENEFDEILPLPYSDAIYTEFEGPDGRLFSGFSRYGQLFKGTITSKDGQYTGSIRNNKPHGYGIYKREGSEYRGMWKDGLQHGEGVYLSMDGPSFKRGVWSNGKLTHWKGHHIQKSTLLKEVMTGQLSPVSLASSVYSSLDASPTSTPSINRSSTGGQV